MGLLVIRVWLEEGVEQDALRARITRTLDVSSATMTETAVSAAGQIVEAVDEWLRAFVDRSPAQR